MIVPIDSSTANGISAAGRSEPPYLSKVEVTKMYNAAFGDDRECQCGHPYYRHFDSYEGNEAVGCKYCECGHFHEGAAPAPALTEEEREALWAQLVAEYEYQLNEVVEAETGFAFQPASKITAMRERLGLETRPPQPEQPSAEDGVDHRGLYNKFRVERRDGKAKHKDCTYFVLDLDHDPHAWPALDAYAEHCKAKHPELAADLRRLTDPNLAGLNYEPIANRVTPPAPAATAEEALGTIEDVACWMNEAPNTPVGPESEVRQARKLLDAVATLRAALAQRTVSNQVVERASAVLLSTAKWIREQHEHPARNPEGALKYGALEVSPRLEEVARDLSALHSAPAKVERKVPEGLPSDPREREILIASIKAMLRSYDQKIFEANIEHDAKESAELSLVAEPVRRWLAEHEG